MVEQIWTATARPLSGLRAAPALDLRMMAGQQHLRNLVTLEDRRPRVMRVLQQLHSKRLVFRRLLRTQDAGDEPAHRVDQHHRRELAAGEDVVTDRDFAVDEVRTDPLVDALIAATDEVEVAMAG